MSIINLGNVIKGTNLYCPFYSTTVLGEPITMVGGDIEVFESNNGVGISTGVNYIADFYGTGSHLVEIDTATYDIALDYSIRVVAGTVDGVDMTGYVVGFFSLENRVVEGIKKNEILNNFEFFMADSSDGRTPKPGITITSSVSKDGGAFGATSNSATEVGNGIYKINLSAADLNADVLTLKFTGTGADGRYITIKTNRG